MAKVLVVGGAGYVGSATCCWLLDQGHKITVLDDFSTGNENFDSVFQGSIETVTGQVGNRTLLRQIFKKDENNSTFDCVFHFAAKSLVGESFIKKDLYFENNVEQTKILLEEMLRAGIYSFVFSSTCAIFGNPGDVAIHENLEKNPINPYGETKLAVENHLLELTQKTPLQAIALRYFNAAGAEPQLRVGECHRPETHLIPNLCNALYYNLPVEIFGTDYPTPDGTAIRDYIHVTDLAKAHEKALLRTTANRTLAQASKRETGLFEGINLGSGTGYSVQEVIATLESIAGKKLTRLIQPRRQGDPPRLVANSQLAQSVLKFGTPSEPLRSLTEILQSAWNWRLKLGSSPGGLKPQKAVFLDRDGTLNFDPGYLSKLEDLKIFDGVSEGLKTLKDAGYLLIVVSNQSGVGRGLIPPKILGPLHEKMNRLFTENGGAPIDSFQLCIHHPNDGCHCRKPKPLLLQQAARNYDIDLSQSYMVGDKLVDISAGRAAGCKAAFLVRTGDGLESERRFAEIGADTGLTRTFIVNDLLEAARLISAQNTPNSQTKIN